MRTDVDLAWLAGLIEGEGTLTTQVERGNVRWHLRVAMTDQDVIAHVHAIAGVGHMREQRAPSHTARGAKPVWVWDVTRRDDLFEIVTALRPYMHTRRAARMDEFLAWYGAHTLA